MLSWLGISCSNEFDFNRIAASYRGSINPPITMLASRWMPSSLAIARPLMNPEPHRER